ncbi:MAG: tetratricopeptide repeat protein [Chlorobia bacterium]|nr:tetratricopeptide repeat protein [Fimbriimonadaceae bacterium]
MICERCFASVKGGSEFCPECGGPMGSGPAEGSDAAIYPELARANLLRMRGDHKAALEQCRMILHKFPNNVTANQLLGDLCAELGDLEQAKEWYELALDIAPNHAQIQKKLKAVRGQLEHAETEGLVEQLGLPPTKSKNGLVAAGLATLVIGVGAIAYVIGTQKDASDSNAAPKQTSVQAPISNLGSSQPPKQDPVPNGTTAPVPTVQGPSDEVSLTQLIAQRSANGTKLLGLTVDPRSNLMILTYRVEAADDKKLIASELAGVAFDNSPSVRVITLRAVEGGTVAYVADARREAYEETKTEAWKQQNGSEPATVAKHLLSQEWPANPTPAENPPPETPASDNNAGP